MRRGHAATAPAGLVAVILAVAACNSATPPHRSSPPALTAKPAATPVAPPAGLLVPWADLAAAGIYPEFPTPSPFPPIPIPAGTPSCHAGQLQGAFMGSQAAAGNLDMPIALRNVSRSACVLDGYAYVTVVDSAGHVLAPVNGTEVRGTFFADWPVVPVLMEVGTPAFSPASGLGLQAVRGQATMNLTWYDCSRPRAARLLLDLPIRGGRLVVPFAMKGGYSPACDGSPRLPVALARDPLSPAGFSWPPRPDYLDVNVDITAPATVQRGGVLRYDVTLTNADSRPYSFDPCPDFDQFLRDKVGATSKRLNCAPAGTLAPGARVSFGMQLDIPAETPAGANDLTWILLDGRLVQPPEAHAGVVVTD
jgi:hypothetical protein